MRKKDNKKLSIRNSTAEFLIFTKQNGKDTIDVRIEDNNIWLTQKLIAKLFGVEIPTINEHLKNIFKNGTYLSKEYFRDLILQIRDIRESERNFYQQITDIYAIAIDYNLKSPITKDFFAFVQNKMHFATHGDTAAELIVKRANHKKIAWD